MNLDSLYNGTMTTTETEYLASQKDSTIPRNDERKMLCFAQEVDPVWEAREKRRKSLQEYQQKQKKEAKQQFQLASSSDISHLDDSEEVPEDLAEEYVCDCESTEYQKERKRVFVAVEEREDDPLPYQFHHVRDGERKGKESVYLALTDLIGIGLSFPAPLKLL